MNPTVMTCSLSNLSRPHSLTSLSLALPRSLPLPYPYAHGCYRTSPYVLLLIHTSLPFSGLILLLIFMYFFLQDLGERRAIRLSLVEPNKIPCTSVLWIPCQILKLVSSTSTKCLSSSKHAIPTQPCSETAGSTSHSIDSD